MNFDAIILAAGKSSRMGRDKAFLEVDGVPLLARQIALAREVGAGEVFISGRSETGYAEFGCPILRDQFPDAGPLAGIERALEATTSSLVLVLAVDLPAMRAEFLQRLKAKCADHVGVIPRLAGNIEPLAAWYPKAARSLAESLLNGKQNSVAAFGVHCVQAGRASFFEVAASETAYFANWNTITDYSASRGIQ